MIEHCPSDEGGGIRGQIIEWCAQDYHIYWRFSVRAEVCFIILNFLTLVKRNDGQRYFIQDFYA